MTRSRLRIPLLALVLLAAPGVPPAAAQIPEDTRVHEAYLAWYHGDYPAAMRGYLDVLAGPDGEAHVATIAALTGESFRTTRLAFDGSDVVVGPDSRYVAWESTGPDGAPRVEVAALDTGERVAVVDGSDATFSSSGRLAWFNVDGGPELARARDAAAEAQARGDRGAWVRALGTVRWLEASSRSLRVRDLASGRDETVDLEGWIPGDAVYAAGTDDLYVVAGRRGDGAANEILRVSPDGQVSVVEAGPGFKANPMPVPGTTLLVYEAPATRPVPVEPGVATSRSGRVGVGVVDVRNARQAFVTGASSPAIAADGSRLAWLGSRDGMNTVESLPLEMDALRDHMGPALVASDRPLAAPAVSPDGRWVAYQKRPVDDWEIFAVTTESPGGEERQITWEIQHDLFPVFLDANTVMAMKGEGRHRRAFLYDLEAEPSATGVRLHHNNTLRTIAPEYEWAAAPDGSAVVVVAERDGDTVSPERGVFLVHLDRPVTRDGLTARLDSALTAETALRKAGRELFAHLADQVRPVTERVDVARIYQHADVLYTFGSKYITQPGNRMAVDHLAATLRSWGYDVELQWFEPGGNRSANVIARLPGTVDPDLVYVVSSHFDSTERGPGADDNTSGTTALLEAARVIKDSPRAATIEFAFFTGEEAGLLGSREYVRRAVESGKRIVGALNNDMVGWSNGPRLDNTIRYSNPGIRDIQHAAAMLFSDLITYDALYYKNTDAHAYYEEYGDIVGGIGSYPVLGNPHYHQFTDRVNTVNHTLVAEVSRTTVATLMLLASSPSRVTGLELAPVSGGVRASWDALPETGIAGYEVAWTDADGRERVERVTGTSHTVQGVAPGTTVRVRGVDRDGVPSWDWARAGTP